MLHLIKPNNYNLYRKDLDNMYRLRHRVFCTKLKWDVNGHDGMEKDQYDEKNAYYLIYKDEHGIIVGCVRFIEMIHDCMFDGPFKHVLSDVSEFKRHGYWETSRFAVDTGSTGYYKSYGQRNVTKMLLAGLIQFGLNSKKVECYLALSYLAFKKLNKKYGLFLYDIHQHSINGKEIFIWAFPPMSYSLDKLTYEQNDYIRSKVVCDFSSVASVCKI